MGNPAPLKLADPLVAEGVRHTLAAYTRALDSGRLDELIGLFTPEGRSELPRMEPAVGHAALRTLYAPLMADHPQRHVVVDTVVTRRDDGRALATSTLLWINARDHAWVV
ncbi:nuclear transport factor 2 family protein [Gordonia sp. DT218]|uniref:nuclear transport factor 2 family protein n=1 Tax=Gordonia sp. DT218 TaxID=3416659 RepID=UPI003CF0A51C